MKRLNPNLINNFDNLDSFAFRKNFKRQDNEYRRVDAKRQKISKRIQKSVDIWF